MIDSSKMLEVEVQYRNYLK